MLASASVGRRPPTTADSRARRGLALGPYRWHGIRGPAEAPIGEPANLGGRGLLKWIDGEQSA